MFDLIDPGIEAHTSRTDNHVLRTELTGRLRQYEDGEIILCKAGLALSPSVDAQKLKLYNHKVMF